MFVSQLIEAEHGKQIRLSGVIRSAFFFDGRCTFMLEDLSGIKSINVPLLLPPFPNAGDAIELIGIFSHIDANEVYYIAEPILKPSKVDPGNYYYVTISEAKEKAAGKTVTIKGVVSEKKVAVKPSDNQQYLLITLQDSTEIMEFPIWNDFEENNKVIQEGKVFAFRGTVNYYDKKFQIKDPNYKEMVDADPKFYIPTYEVPKDLIDYFTKTINSLDDDHRQFAMSAVGWGDAELWEKFLRAPAAVKHHQNKVGGLFIHTVGVMKNLDSMIDLYIDNPFMIDAGKVINKSRLRLKGMIHDIGKIWEYLFDVSIKRKDTKRNHILMGIGYIEEVNRRLDYVLPEDEIENICCSILTHHGNYEKYGRVEMDHVEDYLLHLADMIDSRVAGAAEGK